MKKIFKGNWSYLLSGLLVLIIFSFRFYHLTILPVFADEAIYIRWAQIMKAEETLRFLPLSDGKEPLFMWVTIAALKAVHDPLFAGRLVSVLSGFGTMIGVGLLSWLLFRSRKVSLAAMLIYAVSPFTFFFDRMALVDPMLTMFGVWTFIFTYLAVTKERFDFAMLAGFTLGGAWLTKSPALFFALMMPTIWFFANWKKDFKNNLSVLFKTLTLALTSVLIGYGVFNILRLGPNFELISRRNLDYVYPISHFFVTPLDPLKPYLLQVWQWLMMMGPWGILVLAFGGYMVNYRKRWKELSVLSVWFLFPVVVESEFAKVLTARYVLFTIPFIVVIAASSLATLNKKVYGLILLILVSTVFLSLKFDYHLLINPELASLPRSERSGYLEEWTAGRGIKEVSQYIENYQSENPNKKIIIGTEGYFGTLPDGLQAYLNYDKKITIIGVGLNFESLPDTLTNSLRFGNATFLVINNDRFKVKSKDTLKLIAEYPKAKRPDGTSQSLLFFQLIPKLNGN